LDNPKYQFDRSIGCCLAFVQYCTASRLGTRRPHRSNSYGRVTPGLSEAAEKAFFVLGFLQKAPLGAGAHKILATCGAAEAAPFQNSEFVRSLF
jgi:hypothetical protein